MLKVYKGVRNVILKVSAYEPPSGPKRTDTDAILLGAHIDSTLPAPGAADDGMGVGVMLEIARVLVERNKAFDNSIIFLWNGAEETLQDGSHLYSTQHETAKQVKAVINLEAAGTTGGALLFQATSKEMIEAYSHAPHPRGTVIAADIFSSGIILSDTDFGQFVEYLNVSGLDMAIVGHSYYYHTAKDSIVNIERGSAQHFASNVMSIVDHLLGPQSALSKSTPFEPPDTVYLSLYDRYWQHFSMSAADQWYVALGAISTAVTAVSMERKRLKPLVVAVISTPLGQISGIAAANVVALIMVFLGKRQSWFRHEHLPLVLFAPAAYAGNLACHFAVSRFLSPIERTLLEHSHYHAQMLYAIWFMLLLQAFRIRSAYMFAILGGVLLLGVVGSEAAYRGGKGKIGRVSWFSGYLVPLAIYVFLSVEAVTAVFDVFVPLTGRMGKDAPADNIIATISASVAMVFFPLIVPLFHRLTRPSQRLTLVSLAGLSVFLIVAFAGPWNSAYDATHPKRAILQYTYNHTSGDSFFVVGHMDLGPLPDFVPALVDRYGSGPARYIQHPAEDDHELDSLYPVSFFFEQYTFPLAPAFVDPAFKWRHLKLDAREVSRADGIRLLNLVLDLSGLVIPTLAFEADIVGWSFDFEPPRGKKMHRLKIAATIDDPIVEVELAVREGTGKGDKIDVYWSGIDVNQMVPGTAYEYGLDMPGSKMLIDLGNWAEKRWKGSVDLARFASVTGVISV